MTRGRYQRQDRLIKERRHDTYREWGKLASSAVCRDCGAVFANGRWSWDRAPFEARAAVCPACQRIDDEYPAGFVNLGGEFLTTHRPEIMNLIHNVEEMEKAQHPLERIMKISETDGHTVITTTGVHIARRIGESLARSYSGDFRFAYGDAEKSIRVSWKR